MNPMRREQRASIDAPPPGERSAASENDEGRIAASGRIAGEMATIPPRGRLKHGNIRGDPTKAPRCGARSRRSGKQCRAPAIRGKRRCRVHGGLSTGPRTSEGLARSRRANWKHGRYSQEARKAQARLWAEYRVLLDWGFVVTPVRRRGFHGFRFHRPEPVWLTGRGWRRRL
jgi:hypothetical protein